MLASSKVVGSWVTILCATPAEEMAKKKCVGREIIPLPLEGPLPNRQKIQRLWPLKKCASRPCMRLRWQGCHNQAQIYDHFPQFLELWLRSVYT
jgi:hypothetical protein